MALAIIRFLGQDAGKLHFACDIGTNKYYSVTTGTSDDIVQRAGLVYLNNRKGKTKIRMLAPQMLGRFKLSVASKHFSGSVDHIQLISFKEKNGYGMAWSEIIKIPI